MKLPHKKQRGIFLKILSFLIFLAPFISYAQPEEPLIGPLQASSLLVLIATYINDAVPIVIGLGVLLFIWGVIGFIRNADNEKERANARRFIIFGIIAIFVMVSVWGLVNIILNSLGLDTYPQIPEGPEESSGPTNPIVSPEPTLPLVPCDVQTGGGSATANPCRACHLWQLVRRLIDFLLIAIVPLVGLALAIGGLKIVMAAGSEGSISRGKEIIVSGIWGLVIALAAWLIINTIIQFIANPDIFPFSGGWFSLPQCDN
jgi:hypothetical protein